MRRNHAASSLPSARWLLSLMLSAMTCTEPVSTGDNDAVEVGPQSDVAASVETSETFDVGLDDVGLDDAAVTDDTGVVARDDVVSADIAASDAGPDVALPEDATDPSPDPDQRFVLQVRRDGG